MTGAASPTRLDEGPTVRAPGRRSVLVAAALLGALLAVSIAFRIARFAPPPLDRGWDSLMWTTRDPVAVAVADTFQLLGAGVPAIVLGVLAAVAVWAVRGLFWGAFVLAASLVSELDVRILKVIAMRVRPDTTYGGVGTAFPSGHTAFAALLGIVLLLVIPTVAGRIGVPLLIAGMAWSRTMLHAHWLTDTLAGAATGCAAAVVLVAVAARIAPALPNRWLLRPGIRMLQPRLEQDAQPSAGGGTSRSA